MFGREEKNKRKKNNKKKKRKKEFSLILLSRIENERKQIKIIFLCLFGQKSEIKEN